jgi:hypothetical protein
MPRRRALGHTGPWRPSLKFLSTGRLHPPPPGEGGHRALGNVGGERIVIRPLIVLPRSGQIDLYSRRAAPEAWSMPSRSSSHIGQADLREREGRWSAGRRNQLRAHEARRAPWSGAHASRRSTAAALASALDGHAPGRALRGHWRPPSASSSRPAHSGQAGGAPEPPECPVTNRTRRRRIPLHPPNASGRRPSVNGIRKIYSRNKRLST